MRLSSSVVARRRVHGGDTNGGTAGRAIGPTIHRGKRHVLVVDARIQIPAEEFRFTFSRSGGPGGQNVNKVNSKVTLHWSVSRSTSLPADVRERFLTRYGSHLSSGGELVIHSQRFRDQPRNREDCLDKLRQLIESVRHAPLTRRRSRPSSASRERRLQDKRLRADAKRQRRRPTAWD